MRKTLVIILLLTAVSCFAETTEQPTIVEAPSLGDCSEYTDSYIYQCKEFKCRLPLKIPGVVRQIEILGYDGEKCTYRFALIVRHKDYPPVDLRMLCKLSEKGRLEIANQFTRYKKGDTTVYASPETNPIYGKECEAIH